MCGIAGVIHTNGENADRGTLCRMIERIRHRGPDESDVYVHENVGLGHARLSIVDLAGGRQPMHNGDRSIWITFNGEIFNYPELRAELVKKGHRFSTNSDTEVILHQYEEKGEECVHDFNGQWAFAIWDVPRQKLFLSRDRLGVRPLFYTRLSGAFLFASEIKSLLAFPGISAAPDPAALDEIFTFWFPLAPRTFFRNIQQLLPGHSMSVHNGEVKIKRYWQLDFSCEPRKSWISAAEERDYSEQLLERMVRATQIRLRADVPVGTYLSGGLDSTFITALARRLSDSQVTSFSVTFDEQEFDEDPYQDEASSYLGVQRHAVRCTHHEIAEVFPEVVWHAEQPILRTAPAPLFVLARLVRQNDYKVVLTGEGSDEILGGYDIYKEAKIRRFWAKQPQSERRALLLKKLYPFLTTFQTMPASYRSAFFRVKDSDIASPLFSHLPRWELTAKLKTFFSDEMKNLIVQDNPLGRMLEELPEQYSRWDSFSQAQYLETSYFLPGYLLSSQGDRMAMAHGVEGRFPFLDHHVVEFAAALPTQLKMKVLNEKYLLKRCATGLVPDSVIRRPKQSYRAPDGASFFRDGHASEYVEHSLGRQELRRHHLFDAEAVQRLVDKFRRGAAVGVKDNMALVGVLTTQMLIQQFGETNQEPHRERGIETVHRR